MKRILIYLAALMILTTSSGCFDREIVYAGFAKNPEELNGAISIATNRPISVTIVGDTTTLTQMDLGGMIVIRRADLKKLIELANKANQ